MSVRRRMSKSARTLVELAIIRKSGMFDAEWYLARNPDVAESGRSALLHYFRHGVTEGRDPSPWFFTSWYLTSNPDVTTAGIHPLLHFINHGDQELRAPSPLFAPDHYLAQIPVHERPKNPMRSFLAGRRPEATPNRYFDVAHYLSQVSDPVAKRAPFQHYLDTGWRIGLEPNAKHSFVAYSRWLHARGLGDVNPLWYYLKFGESAGDPLPGRGQHPRGVGHAPLFVGSAGAAGPSELATGHEPGPFFEPSLVGTPELAKQARARIFAFYLPQFHPIPENDRWWGPGFNEWTNVTRGRPRFVDHEQPRIPRDLGFYDLRVLDTIRRQVDYAQRSAVSGFAFYYYWFGGTRLLETPLEMFLGSDIDFPFFLLWANENWTRRWDGLDQEVLIAQEHSLDDDVALVDDLARYFQDPRYERVDGRPLWIVYRPGVIPDCTERLARWRELFRERHDLNPLVLSVLAFDHSDPRDNGFDGSIEFPPHHVVSDLPIVQPDLLDPNFEGHYFDYDAAARVALDFDYPDFEVIRTVVPSWDNEARRPGRGMGLVGASPAKYQRWLAEVVSRAAAHPFADAAPYVFVNAWNEWAEAAYLEPDQRNGAAYLNATFRAALGLEVPASQKPRVLLVGHDGHRHGAQLVLLNIMRTLVRVHGFDVTVVLLDGGAVVHDYAELGEVVILQDSEVSVAQTLSTLVERSPRIAFALTNTVVTGLVAKELAQLGLRTVSLIHEMGTLVSGGYQQELAALIEHADRIIFPSKFVRRSIESVSHRLGNRAIVRPQGMYMDLQPDPKAGALLRKHLTGRTDTPIVVNIGYGTLRKGFDLFVHIARIVATAAPKTHFVWLGEVDGQVRQWLSHEFDQAPLAGRFHILPFDADETPYLSAASVMALTSREDPFPSVMLEALSCGVPVVGFAGSGGVEDVVTARAGNGELVQLGDLAGFARAIIRRLEGDPVADQQARINWVRSTFGWGDYVSTLIGELIPGYRSVSVIVPNYNYARHLVARLTSIFDQSYPIHELIVLDDASTDDSLAVLEDLRLSSGRDFRIVPAETNSGSVFAQWRAGVELATGDCVWIAEADDLASFGFLESAIAAMTDKTVLAFCDSRQIDENGAELAPSYGYDYAGLPVNPMIASFDLEGAEFAREVLAIKNAILNVSSVVFDRAALSEVLRQSFDDIAGHAVAGDWRVYAELLLTPGARVSYVHTAHNVHRRHTDSVTRRLDAERHFDEIVGMQQFFARAGIRAEIRQAASDYLTEVSRYLGRD